MARHSIAAVAAVLGLVFFTLTVRSQAPRSGGDRISPPLRSIIAEASGGSTVHITLRLSTRADIPALLSRLAAENAPLARRHREVVTALREAAGRSQPPVEERLEALRREGSVFRYESRWIANIIEVVCRADVVEEIAGIEAVESISPTPVAVPIGMLPGDAVPDGGASIDDALRIIGADSLWRSGLTGESRIVAHIDKGVDGSHPALADRWRGLFAPPEECWLAPGTDFPFDSSGHGTRTMGVLTGRDSATGDTTGVAIDALWIAARYGLDQHSVSTSQALEWMADPDGDPETFDDVPDVVSNSWIYAPPTQCLQTDWDIIDNLEAAGPVVMFAAGNYGPDVGTVGSPGNRNTTDVNGFSVGAVDNYRWVAWWSSRGPSPCDDVTKKPEVTAPGVNVRTTDLGGGYIRVGGTSISCPVTAGVVALVRQINPEATPEEIKHALLETAGDRGDAGDDNDYGMGVVNAYRAAQDLSPYRIAGTVRDGDTGSPIGTATISVVETQQVDRTDTAGGYEIGALADEVTLIFEKFGYYPDTSGTISLGDSTYLLDVDLEPIPTGSISGTVVDSTTGHGVQAGVILYSNGAPVDTVVTEAGTGFYRFENVPASDPPLVDYDAMEGRFLAPYPDSITFAMSVTVEPGEETGVDLEVGPVSVLIADDDLGLGFERYFTGPLDSLGWSYRHHDVEEEGESVIYTLPAFPAGTILIWFSGTKEETLTPEDQDSLSAYLERGGKLFLTGQNFAEDLAAQGSPFLLDRLHAEYAGNTDLEDIEGVSGDPVFDGLLIRTNGAGGANDQYSRDVLIPRGQALPACYYREDGAPSDSTAGLLVDDAGQSGSRIVFLGFGFEAVNRPEGEDSYVTRRELLDRILSWLDVPVGIGDGDVPEGGSLPRAWSLRQNFPNPFNPVTTITCDVPRGGSPSPVRLVVFDVRGRAVRTLIGGDDTIEPGRHRVVWDGRDDGGAAVPSGIYLYQLAVDGRSFARKMLLLR